MPVSDRLVTSQCLLKRNYPVDTMVNYQQLPRQLRSLISSWYMPHGLVPSQYPGPDLIDTTLMDRDNEYAHSPVIAMVSFASSLHTNLRATPDRPSQHHPWPTLLITPPSQGLSDSGTDNRVRLGTSASPLASQQPTGPFEP